MSSSSSSSAPRSFLLACVVGSVVACSPSSEESADSTAEALAPPPAGGYTWSRAKDELRKNVPVHRDADWRVIYSLSLQDLTAAERLAVRGEVQLTVCQQSDVDNGSCGHITPYAPTYKAKIVLGDSRDDANGKDLSRTVDIECTHVRHHCALAIPESVGGGFSGSKFANLAVAAVDPQGGGNDVMIVNEGDGAVFVTRIGKDVPAHGDDHRGSVVTGGWMQLDMENAHPRKPHVTLQAKLTGVHGGEIVGVDAAVEAVTRGGGSKPAGCDGARDPLITNEVYVSGNAGDPLGGSKIASIAPKNGKNCAIGDTCNYAKSASYQLPKNVPSEVYVSVVSWGGRSCSAPGDEWRLGGASSLHVEVRGP